MAVDFGNLAGVFDIYIDFALAVRRCKLGLAAERNGLDNFPGGGIDYGRILAAAVEGEYQFGERVVQNGVGIGAGFHLADDFEGF